MAARAKPLTQIEKALSFADNAPRSLGRFPKHTETLTEVEQNGWQATGLRASCNYLGEDRPLSGGLYTETALDSVRLRRRPCDGFTLQAEKFHEFERENRTYFPFQYRCPYSDPRRRDQYSAEEKRKGILLLAHDEFAELDYLHPLASVVQVIRPDLRIPFVTRCWDFAAKPGALIKKSRLLFGGSEELEGACICYQPPTLYELSQNSSNYFIFRNVVGHEVGHYWWETPARRQDSILADLKGDLVEQAVSLFSIFLIMYRGYWEREEWSRGELAEAFDTLRFETTWAARDEQKILDEIEDQIFLRRTYLPNKIDSTASQREFAGGPELSERAILAIRAHARELAEQAAPVPFASTAAVIMQRKIDSFISFDFMEPSRLPRWDAVDREARHLGLPEGLEVRSQWREYKLEIPRYPEGEMPLVPYLNVAHQLAHIRLHGDRFGHSTELMESEKVDRAFGAEGSDLARILALALYAQDGRKKRRRLGIDLAKILLREDPSGLSYLTPYAEKYFQWCCEDTDCPRAEDRFLAEIREVGVDEVHFTFWGDDGERFRGSLPISDFISTDNPKDEIRPLRGFKLFGVRENGIPRLRPFLLPE